MLKKLFATMAMLAATLLGTAAMAEDYGSKEDAVAMVDRAIALYEAEGLDALSAAVNDPENTDFHDKDLYVFVFDNAGVALAHGANEKLIGKDLSGLTDQNGVQIIQEMLILLNAGEAGWVDYSWPHPVTQQLAAKSAYIDGFDGDTKLLGVGIHVQ